MFVQALAARSVKDRLNLRDAFAKDNNRAARASAHENGQNRQDQLVVPQNPPRPHQDPAYGNPLTRHDTDYLVARREEMNTRKHPLRQTTVPMAEERCSRLCACVISAGESVCNFGENR